MKFCDRYSALFSSLQLRNCDEVNKQRKNSPDAAPLFQLEEKY